MLAQPHQRALARAEFRQRLPDEQGWELDTGTCRHGTLTYRRGDELIIVPNIWYNQPVAWRVHTHRFWAQEKRDAAAKLRQDPNRHSWTEKHIADAERVARECDALADEMERTGRVLG